jgi:hypothetical protein
LSANGGIALPIMVGDEIEFDFLETAEHQDVSARMRLFIA